MNWINELLQVIQEQIIPISLTVVLFAFYIILRLITNRLIKRHARKLDVVREREAYIRKLNNIFLFLLMISLLGAIWEISIRGLSLYFASVFTITGVALFATWSVLSNLTASILIFFFFPYRIGHNVKVMDGDNSVEGQILDITFFYMKIKTPEGAIITFPNNLVIQKAFVLKS